MTIDSIGLTGKTGANVTGTHTATPAARSSATPGTASSSAVKGSEASPSDDQVDKAVADLNKAAQEKTPGIEFSIDPDSKRTIVQVVDQSTKQVLQQFPSKEALAIAKSFDESSAQGALINQTA
jgi:flagellar protein FlaG